MDFSDFQERLALILKKNFLPLVLGGAGIVLLLYGLISSVLPSSQKQDILFESGSSTGSESATLGFKDKTIAVDVEGAVMKPGVYKLPVESRVQDALIAAGGMSNNADRGKVAKGLNLASKITDGGKIYIPFEGEAIGVAGSSTSDSFTQSSGGLMGESNGNLININSASASELDSLPGIGAVTAEKIISNRPYATIEELVSKKAVGQSVYTKIKDKISL